MLALLDLPDELLLHVALHCDDVADVSRFARACTALHALIAHTDHFWSLMLARHFSMRIDDDVDHRARFRERCARLEWAWPPRKSTTSELVHACDGDVVDRSTVLLRVQPRSHSVLLPRDAFCEPPLPSAGVTIVAIHIANPLLLLRVGVVACDLADKWQYFEPPERAPRAFCDGLLTEFVKPTCSMFADAGVSKPAFQPAGWVGSRTPRAVLVGVDASRGRVYMAHDAPASWLIGFDDGVQLAGLGNLRVYARFKKAEVHARIERVPVTEAIRARLREVDEAFAARCAAE